MWDLIPVQGVEIRQDIGTARGCTWVEKAGLEERGAGSGGPLFPCRGRDSGCRSGSPFAPPQSTGQRAKSAAVVPAIASSDKLRIAQGPREGPGHLGRHRDLWEGALGCVAWVTWSLGSKPECAGTSCQAWRSVLAGASQGEAQFLLIQSGAS